MDGGQVGTDKLFCRPDCPLESFPIQFGGRSKPDSYGRAEKRLDDCSVELDQQLLRQVVLPELAQEVYPLLGLFDDCFDVWLPLQVLGDCGTQKPEGFHSRHSTVQYGDGGLLLKSTVISTVFSAFSSRLLRPHHRTSCSTSRLWAACVSLFCPPMFHLRVYAWS